MEVIKGDDKLRDEILNDAKNKAENILKRANRDAEEIIKNIDAEIENYEKEIASSTMKSIEEERKRIFASIDIDVKKKRLSFIGGVIDGIFDSVKDSIIEGKTQEPKRFISNLIKRSLDEMNSSSYSVEVGKLEDIKLTEKEIKDIKLKNGSIDNLVYSENKEGYYISNKEGDKLS
ncbi:MAG TPA: V-type ATP synthase subunit E family protein, partial [Spirochaetota bacterium]|nr:V-type ATP synthase subunit E family protein [Spirochaetota bacterium]